MKAAPCITAPSPFRFAPRPPTWSARIAGAWRRWRERRDERLRFEALADLSPHLLRDLGVDDGARERAAAIRGARRDRLMPSIVQSALITGRLVP